MADTKSTLKSRDKAILKVGIALIIAIAGYLAGNTISTKTNVINKENETLQKRVDDLEEADKNKDNLKKDLKRMDTDTKYILDKFPSNMTFEKVLKKVSTLWKERYAFGMTDISYNDNGVFYTFQDNTGKEIESLGRISSVTVKVNYATDSETLKNLIDLINQEFDTKTSITTLNIEPSKEIKSYEGEIQFTVYYGGTTREYEEPKFDVDTGKKDMFN